MNSFHEYFKYEFKEIYEAADGSFTKRGLSLAMYLDSVRSFNSHLTMHHTIEERHIFPILAKKIPKFANTAENGHVDSHKAIHDGLEALMKLVTNWRKEPTTYSPREMIATLDKLKPVLFEHLDQEVQDLKGDQLKLHFTLKEIESLSRM
ncbi:hypothetical protein BDZ94DRAFT_433533 [Collybia nuda]|uniref:Hemerythrin-like domain-containing protein n=1 Tax=Collybia nuda TaxID=64659 RepID=A0A9P6CK74_9AGAR|nr:hypothetical protein BDZ94DRAFT_433533 [Collybia nuda]